LTGRRWGLSDDRKYHVVVVKLRGRDDEIVGPEIQEEAEAERQLGVIRATLDEGGVVDLPWLATTGRDVTGAWIEDRAESLFDRLLREDHA
jgi:hypothetical protein